MGDPRCPPNLDGFGGASSWLRLPISAPLMHVSRLNRFSLRRGGTGQSVRTHSNEFSTFKHPSSVKREYLLRQVFLACVVKEYGPVAWAAVATLRQVISTFISYQAYSHSINVLQVMGLLLLFVALVAGIRFKVHFDSKQALGL